MTRRALKNEENRASKSSGSQVTWKTSPLRFSGTSTAEGIPFGHSALLSWSQCRPSHHKELETNSEAGRSLVPRSAGFSAEGTCFHVEFPTLSTTCYTRLATKVFQWWGGFSSQAKVMDESDHKKVSSNTRFNSALVCLTNLDNNTVCIYIKVGNCLALCLSHQV